MISENSKEKDLAKSLKNTIAYSNLTEIGINAIEVSIDSIMKDGFLKDIPIIGSLIGIWKTGVTIKDSLFLNKLISFLNETNKLSDQKRKKIIENLEDENYQTEAGEKLIAIIDKLETTSKARMLGKALFYFGESKITSDEFWRVSFVIERLPLSDIVALKDWKTSDLNTVNEIRKHLYLSVGLGWFVLDISSSGFCWQKRLCEIFSIYLIEY